MALSSGITTAETDVSSNTQRNQARDGDSESTGVASQAPDTLSTSSAEGQDGKDATSKLSRNVRSLKISLIIHDVCLKLLFQKAATLEMFAEKSRSLSA